MPLQSWPRMKMEMEGFSRGQSQTTMKNRPGSCSQKPKRRSLTRREGDGKTFHQQESRNAPLRDCSMPSLLPLPMEAFVTVFLCHFAAAFWVWAKRRLDNWHFHFRDVKQLDETSECIPAGGSWAASAFHAQKEGTITCVRKRIIVNFIIIHNDSSSPCPPG